MTFALVAHTIKQTVNTTSVTTDAIDTTGAKLLVAITCDNGGGFAVTDSKSNTWYSFADRTVSGITTRIHAALANPTVGSGHTFSHSSGSVFFPAIAVMVFSATGMVIWETTKPEEGGVSSSATSIAHGVGMTPLYDNSLFVMGLGDTFGTSLAIDIGTLADQMPLVPGVAFGVASAYEIQTALSAINPVWSWTTAGRVEATMGLFREFKQATPTTFDPNTKGNGTLSNGNKTFTSNTSATDNPAYSTTHKTTGKWYLECSHANVGNNNSRIGLSGPLGVQAIADMWRNIGDHGLGGMPDCLAIDLDNMKVWGRIGSGNWNGNPSADPSTNTLGSTITASIANGCWFYVDSAQDSANPTWTVNFGAITFTQSVPSGFSAWDNYSGSGIGAVRNKQYKIR